MKGKFRSMWRVGIALALVLSLSLVAAAPVAASPGSTGITLGATAGNTAEWSTVQKKSGSYSALLTFVSGDHAYVEFVPAPGTTVNDLADITGTSFWYYLTNATPNGGPVLELRFTAATCTDPEGAGHVDITVNTAEADAGHTHDAWTQLPVTSASTCVYFGNDPTDGTGFYDNVGNVTLAGVLTSINAQDAMTAATPDDTATSWELTRVRADIGWTAGARTCYIDDVAINGVTCEIEPLKFVNASDAEIKTVSSTGSFYLNVACVDWNASEFVQDTGQVTLKVYSVYTASNVLVSTNTYTMTESGNNTGRFRTGAISGTALSLKPGYKLEASILGTSFGSGSTGAAEGSTPGYAAAEVSFDKTLYSIDEEMTLTVEDDSVNLVATTPLDTIVVSTPSTVTKLDIDKKAAGDPTNLTLTETGVDTGIFQVKVTPRLADTTGTTIWCNDAMDLAYTNTYTTTGAGTGGSNIITKTAYVSSTSPSSVAFVPSTIAVTDTSVDVVVIDRDESPTSALGADTISSAVVVKSLAADDSVIDSLTVATLTENTAAGQFKATVTFGTGATQLDKTGAAKLQATYTDPNDSADVSTTTAAVGYTVLLYNASDVLVNSYTTITAAEAAVVANDYTIVVKSGYASSDEAWPVTIDAFTGLTIKAEDGATVILDPWLASGADGIFQVNEGSVTIQGLALKHSKTATDPDKLILVQADGDSLTVKDCTFDLTAGAADDTGISFDAADITGVVIDGCTFNVGASATAIDSIIAGAFGVDFDVKNCIFTGSSGTGLTIDHSGGAATVDADVTSNTFDGLAKALIIAQTTGTTNVEVKWNTVKNSSSATVGAIEISNSATVSIVSNDITDNTGYSIWVKTDDTNVDVVFNNISGNAKVLKNNDTDAVPLNAKHNWWGHVTAPTTSDVSSLTYVDTTYYLTAPVKLTAEYTEAAGGLFDKHLTTGVKVAAGGTGSAAADFIGVAQYTETPKAELSGASFYDAFVATYAGIDATSSTVTASFYTEGVTADSVAYFWNDLSGTWDACSNQGFNSYAGYIWVLAKDQTATVPTYPTIQELTGSMFAICTAPAVTLDSIAASPESVTLDVDETQQLTVTATYSDDSTADVTAEASYESSDTSVATVSAAGLITGVAVGDATVTVTYLTETTTVSVTVGFDPMVYDADGDGVISKTEALTAVADYFSGAITKAQALLVIVEYMG